MLRWFLLLLFGCAALAAQQAPIPAATELGGHPYAIKNKWVIGGSGNWGYLALDPAAHQLFITRQTKIQVVDIETGKLAGEITGFAEARSVALDPNGQFGYVGDGRDNSVRIFNRSTLQVEASIPISCPPRSITLVPEQELLFAICGAAAPSRSTPAVRTRTSSGTAPNQTAPGQGAGETRRPASGDSQIEVIDTQARGVLANISVPGDLRIAQADHEGQVYITAGATELTVDSRTGARESWPQRIVHLDAAAIASDAHQELASRKTNDPVNWSERNGSPKRHANFIPLSQACPSPQGIAVDGRNLRLFVACENQEMLILDARHGDVVANATTGPGTDAIAYNESGGLIFTANGGGYGSLTIVRRHEPDSYAVIQNLPTLPNARTLAVDPTTGLVYLVTVLSGASLENPPASGIGTLSVKPIDSTFEVLVIGN